MRIYLRPDVPDINTMLDRFLVAHATYTMYVNSARVFRQSNVTAYHVNISISTYQPRIISVYKAPRCL